MYAIHERIYKGANPKRKPMSFTVNKINLLLVKVLITYSPIFIVSYWKVILENTTT